MAADGSSKRASGVLAGIGPGLAVAATGVGAGDLLAAMVAGADFGVVLAWVIAIGSLLKYALNEGIARWQLATGTTLIDGWCRHLGLPFVLGFLLYLLVWSVVVAAGLMSACGVAAHALCPAVGIRSWAILHSLAALALVLLGRYAIFERVMGWLAAVMVATLLASAVLVGTDLWAVLRGLVMPALPAGSAAVTLGLMGGVGGSVTLLSYGYWVREHGWSGAEALRPVRLDLAIGYLLTGVFGVATLALAAAVLAGSGGMPPGSEGLVVCSESIREAATLRLGPWAGAVARLVFLAGVWGAVATSILGVWQGVPYLFADFVRSARGRPVQEVDTRGWTYRSFLLFLALPPMLLLFLDRPIWLIRLYTVTGGLFMPILAASLLWLNSRKSLAGEHRNRLWSTVALVAALALFVATGVRELLDLAGGG
jgi:Mn2+/Fe2+ NRAMP family transporter